MTLAENTPSMSHGALPFDAMVGASVGGRRGMSCNELCSGLLEVPGGSHGGITALPAIPGVW